MAERTSPWTHLPSPSLDEFAAMAEQALATLRQPFRGLVGDVAFRIEDFADEEVLDDLGLEDPFDLTGLYQGPDLAHRSVLDPLPAMPMVFLYRRPILDEWAERGDVSLGELIRHVLVHEIGHHLGFSDRDIERIEARR